MQLAAFVLVIQLATFVLVDVLSDKTAAMAVCLILLLFADFAEFVNVDVVL